LLFLGVVVCFRPPVISPKVRFDTFVAKYHKSYATEDEKAQRFAIFRENLERIESMNTKTNSKTYGITKFSDLTPQEFTQSYLMNIERQTAPTAAKIAFPQDFDLPTEYDWRDKGAVTPVYNQGQCGSCWAFSATEAIESQWFLANGKLKELSMQQIVDCDTGNGDEGCEGGDTTTAYEYVIKAGGLDSLSDYPYVGEDENCAFNKSDITAKITSWGYVTQDKNETEMQYGLMAKGPLSICVDAESWQFYEGGVISDLCGDELDHCVMITGFQDYSDIFGTYQVWNIRNSWGSDWGENGYLYVERGYDLCGVADEVTLPVV